MNLDEARVLAANRAFYAAFAKHDAVAMETLWCKRAPVSCVHPGWIALQGRDDVVGSWNELLGTLAETEVACTQELAHVIGDAAFVTCHERVGDAELVVTNVFFREDGEWRIAVHHASNFDVGDDDEEEGDDDDDSGKMLN